MSDLARRVAGLGRALAELSAEKFAALSSSEAVGPKLSKASSAIAKLVPTECRDEWGTYSERVSIFDHLERDLQAVEVARGLRLCRQLVGRPPLRKAGERFETETLPGIGPTIATKLAERGIESIEHLLFWIPRRYIDARRLTPLEDVDASEGGGQMVALRGRVSSCRFVRRGPRRWVDLRLKGIEDEEARVVVRWFHARGGMADRFAQEAEVALAGPLRIRDGHKEMANPTVLGVTPKGGEEVVSAGQILLRYAEVPGVPGKTLAKAARAAAVRGQVRDPIPEEISERVGLAPLSEALERLHNPPVCMSPEEVDELNRGDSRWHRRLAFGELFLLALAVAQRRQELRSGTARPCPRERTRVEEELKRVFPFALTAAQARAIETIGKDLSETVPMNRLLQGDVGSGKTAVVFAAALQTVRAGRQVALMAPTEILAEQHDNTLSEWGRKVGLRVTMLSASLPSGVRSSRRSLISEGHVDLVIGTHALLSEGVAFSDLGLVVIDEQHRFGVAQRVRLRDKGEAEPHLLVATATPIPRTLALTAYGDLDVTVLDELPPGRKPVETEVLRGPKGRERAYRLLRQTLAEGRRAFVICPLVEPAEDGDTTWADATGVAERLKKVLEPTPVGLVHGRLSHAERAETMERFRRGEIQVLVATTVVEVGVDVPEATLIIIMDADRFGLAQLHQLRGRVGRGQDEARCLLVTRGAGTEAATTRLGAMAETTDGFKIADADLALRGPGELLGARQAGLPRLRFGDLVAHTELLLKAREQAERLLSEDPGLERHPELSSSLAQRLEEARAYGAESG